MIDGKGSGDGYGSGSGPLKVSTTREGHRKDISEMNMEELRDFHVSLVHLETAVHGNYRESYDLWQKVSKAKRRAVEILEQKIVDTKRQS